MEIRLVSYLPKIIFELNFNFAFAFFENSAVYKFRVKDVLLSLLGEIAQFFFFPFPPSFAIFCKFVFVVI